jgi:hypothetical protein
MTLGKLQETAGTFSLHATASCLFLPFPQRNAVAVHSLETIAQSKALDFRRAAKVEKKSQFDVGQPEIVKDLLDVLRP